MRVHPGLRVLGSGTVAGPMTSLQRSARGFWRLLGLLSGAFIAAGGCTSTSDSLGYDDIPVGLDGGSGGTSGTGGTDNPEGGDGADDPGGSDGMGDPGGHDGGG